MISRMGRVSLVLLGGLGLGLGHGLIVVGGEEKKKK